MPIPPKKVSLRLYPLLVYRSLTFLCVTDVTAIHLLSVSLPSLTRLHTLTLIDGSTLDDTPSNISPSTHFLRLLLSPTLRHLRIQSPHPTYWPTRPRLQEAYEANHRELKRALERLLLEKYEEDELISETIKVPKLEKVVIAEEVFDGVVRDLYGFSEEEVQVRIGEVSVWWDRSGETAWAEDHWDATTRKGRQRTMRLVKANRV